MLSFCCFCTRVLRAPLIRLGDGSPLPSLEPPRLGTAETLFFFFSLSFYLSCSWSSFSKCFSAIERHIAAWLKGSSGVRKKVVSKGWFWRMFPRNESRNEGTFAKTTLLRNRPFISQWAFLVSTKGWFPKGWFRADVPPERKPERGYVREGGNRALIMGF